MLKTVHEDHGAAFFDLDHTLVAKASTLAFGRSLYREGLISPGVAVKIAYAQLVLRRLGVTEARMERTRAAVLELTRGWEAERVTQLVRATLHEVIDPLIYAEARALLELHRQASRTLYLVSSSGVEVVRPIAEYLGISDVIATQVGIDGDGRYDGTVVFYAYGEHKARAIRDEATRRHIDLAASWAYSDSITDLPMLSTVGHPVAVNPDPDLRAIARARGWPVKDFARPTNPRGLRARFLRIRRNSAG